MNIRLLRLAGLMAEKTSGATWPLHTLASGDEIGAHDAWIAEGLRIPDAAFCQL